MKLLYVGPRYHTNQLPVMAGWKDRGDEVHFFAQYEGTSEERDYVNFNLMPPSRGTLRRYEKINRKYPADEAETKRTKAFLPQFGPVYRKIKEIRPDVVIVRECSKPNAVVLLACRLLGIRNLVVYTQEPLYSSGTIGFARGLFRHFCFPKAVFTPVLYRGGNTPAKPKASYPGAPGWFVPFASFPAQTFERQYCRDGVLRVLDVGKYRDYKNHFLLVDAVAAMADRSNLRVTIIGQLANDSEREYYERLQKRIEELGLEDTVTLRGNVPFAEMEAIYRENDVLVLPSKIEMASIAILEAMANGLCVCSSLQNGTACYLEKYDCGFTFSVNGEKDLAGVLDRLYRDTALVEATGKTARRVVNEHLQFDGYFRALNDLLQAEYGFQIP